MKKQTFRAIEKGFSALFTLSLLCSLIVFSSCEEDEENGPSVAFIDQPIQGTVEGESWQYVTGTAKSSQVSSDGGRGYSIELTSTEFTDPCSEFILQTKIRFLTYGTETGYYDMDNDGFANFIGVGFVVGGLEITSITSSTLSGRADVEYTDPDTGVTSEINGNFTVPNCD